MVQAILVVLFLFVVLGTLLFLAFVAGATAADRARVPVTTRRDTYPR